MWHSLLFKVMVIVGGILSACIALLLVFTARTHESQLLRHAILHTGRMSDMAARSIRPEMLAQERTAILDIFDAYTQEEELEKIRLFDKDGIIVLSTQRSEIKDSVDMTHEMCIKCHAEGPPHVLPPPLERGRIFRNADGARRLAIITPIYNAPACYTCHDSSLEVLGVLDAVFSLQGVDASIHRVRQAAIASGVLAILTAWVAVAFVLQRFVRQPVHRLLVGTQRVAEGDLGVEVAVAADDELGRLCAAFNAMNAKLKKAADEHTRWNRQLENQVKTATKELEAANEGLRAADRRRAEFIRTVVHQLRAPVSAMQSFLRLITRRIVGELTPKQQDLLERVDKKCGLLLATVNDLLDMAAVSDERPQRPPESVDLGELIARCVGQFSHLAQKKDVRLTLNGPPDTVHIRATTRDLEYAASNLLSNAVHYTREGTIDVTLRSEGPVAVLTVTDTGIGIPEHDIPHCLREFYRGDNVTQHLYEGTGLGLSIVKKVADKYGGTIDLQSTLGTGTTVTLTLPRTTT
ncbi:MAG: HAMP domain-containing histidine kinase [Gemmatimonadetes bacterium]|nr:HAMP domain-containing histidine kinase [Gemmatimonadota bacterium]